MVTTCRRENNNITGLEKIKRELKDTSDNMAKGTGEANDETELLPTPEKVIRTVDLEADKN